MCDLMSHAMTIVEERPAITGGVDTHSEVHVAAALDSIGGLLGVRVVEVDRADRQDRRRRGKSDPLDAVSAPGLRSPAGRSARPRAAMGRWRRSGR